MYQPTKAEMDFIIEDLMRRGGGGVDCHKIGPSGVRAPAQRRGH
jgi:hypothetical protein